MPTTQKQDSTPDLIDRIVTGIQSASVSWDAWIAAFRQTKHYGRQAYTPENLPSLLGEVYLHLALQQTLASLEGVVLQPIADKAALNGYMFGYDEHGKLTVWGGRNKVAEYDELVLADGIPFVLESKLSSHRKNWSRAGRSTNGLRAMLTEPSISRFLHPISTYFNSGCAFAVMTYPENIREHSPVQHAFREMGGILFPFRSARQEYFKEVKFMRGRYGI